MAAKAQFPKFPMKPEIENIRILKERSDVLHNQIQDLDKELTQKLEAARLDYESKQKQIHDEITNRKLQLSQEQQRITDDITRLNKQQQQQQRRAAPSGDRYPIIHELFDEIPDGLEDFDTPSKLNDFFADLKLSPERVQNLDIRPFDIIKTSENGDNGLFLVYPKDGKLNVIQTPGDYMFPFEALPLLRKYKIETMPQLYDLYGQQFDILGINVDDTNYIFPDPGNQYSDYDEDASEETFYYPQLVDEYLEPEPIMGKQTKSIQPVTLPPPKLSTPVIPPPKLSTPVIPPPKLSTPVPAPVISAVSAPVVLAVPAPVVPAVPAPVVPAPIVSTQKLSTPAPTVTLPVSKQPTIILSQVPRVPTTSLAPLTRSTVVRPGTPPLSQVIHAKLPPIQPTSITPITSTNTPITIASTIPTATPIKMSLTLPSGTPRSPLRSNTPVVAKTGTPTTTINLGGIIPGSPRRQS